jgi:Skp family chaperone for outer membrane proteins
MSQRGLPKRLLDVVLEFGKANGDKLILNKKATQKVIEEIDTIRKELLKVLDKGGVTIVLDNSALITAYNTNSYKRN